MDVDWTGSREAEKGMGEWMLKDSGEMFCCQHFAIRMDGWMDECSMEGDQQAYETTGRTCYRLLVSNDMRNPFFRSLDVSSSV